MGWHKRFGRMIGTWSVLLLALGLSGCACPGVRTIRSLVWTGRPCPHCGCTVGEDCRCRPDPWSHGLTVWRPLMPEYIDRVEPIRTPETLPPGTIEENAFGSSSASYEASLLDSSRTTWDETVAREPGEEEEPEAVEVDAGPWSPDVSSPADRPIEEYEVSIPPESDGRVRCLSKPPDLSELNF